MTQSRDNYQVMGQELPDVVNRINFILARIADRLDKLEGIRGELETASGTFSGAVTATEVSADLLVKDDDGITIHSMES